MRRSESAEEGLLNIFQIQAQRIVVIYTGINKKQNNFIASEGAWQNVVEMRAK